MSDIKVFRRRISPEQQQRSQLIVAEASKLVSQHGAAISMESVAAASGVSRSTLYRYYTSREHLLAEVTLKAGYELIELLNSNPPQGDTIGQKIETLCHQLTSMAGVDKVFLACCMSNLMSEDPAVIDAYQETEQLVSGIFGSVLGDVKPALGNMIQTVIFRYLLGSFMLASTGKLDFEEVANELAAICQLLMADVWSVKCD